MDRATGKVPSTIGHGTGLFFQGQLFDAIRAAVDSKGNVYVAEDEGPIGIDGRRSVLFSEPRIMSTIRAAKSHRESFAGQRKKYPRSSSLRSVQQDIPETFIDRGQPATAVRNRHNCPSAGRNCNLPRCGVLFLHSILWKRKRNPRQMKPRATRLASSSVDLARVYPQTTFNGRASTYT